MAISVALKTKGSTNTIESQYAPRIEHMSHSHIGWPQPEGLCMVTIQPTSRAGQSHEGQQKPVATPCCFLGKLIGATFVEGRGPWQSAPHAEAHKAIP